MAVQQALFYDRFEEVLALVIDACGGRKRFAAELWPAKPQRDAHNLLDACLNPERREKFSPSDIVYILRRGRDVGCHAGHWWLDEQTGYARAAPLDPADEKAELLRREEELVAELRTLLDRRERMREADAASQTQLARVLRGRGTASGG